MIHSILIKNANIVNEGSVKKGSILIEGNFIKKIIYDEIFPEVNQIIDANGKYLFPGLIDDQVHFREPGLTHKGEIYTEAKAAVAGGITSYMEMPNTQPQTLTQELLEKKYERAAEVSLANYSFYMGTSNDNLEELLKTDPSSVCGIKIFMGASTGNMLVDNPTVLDQIFSKSKMLIALHCEDEQTIRENTQKAVEKFGENIPITEHPTIRSREACYKSSSRAIQLAKKYNTRLHILHISTKEELDLFTNEVPLKDKRITAEACIHHLWFFEKDYNEKGAYIKWNPAVKNESDRDAILEAVLNDRIDVIATDHAPHTIEEKKQSYLKCPSGGPLVQHSLQAMLELHHQGKISLAKIAEKMCHNVADMFDIDRRGYIREGYYADLVLVDLDKPYTVKKENILYKCGWSPLEGTQFPYQINSTFVSGHLAYHLGQFDESKKGTRLQFSRA